MTDSSPARSFAAAVVIFVPSLVLPYSARPMRAQAPRRPAAAVATPYYPERFDWQKQTPEQARIDAAKLEAAIKFAVASENPGEQGSGDRSRRRRSAASHSTRRSVRSSRAAR